jgi:hypothetical protein
MNASRHAADRLAVGADYRAATTAFGRNQLRDFVPLPRRLPREH